MEIILPKLTEIIRSNITYLKMKLQRSSRDGTGKLYGVMFSEFIRLYF